MMIIENIYSDRRSYTEVYSDLIYEWEEDFSNQLKVPIVSYSKWHNKFLNGMTKIIDKFRVLTIIQHLDKIKKPKKYTLIFNLCPTKRFSYRTSSNKIPYIIDFDFRVDLSAFYSNYKNCALVLISSLESYNYLIKNKCPLKIKHLPLSISDRYKLYKDDNTRKYDAIIARPNRVFMNYIERYASDHPSFEYVIRKWEGSAMYKGNVYYSNKKGAIGEFSDRAAYFELLKNTKVALYATPGLDEPNKRFMNHVTPSLFEYISSGCRIIARYADNAETASFNLKSFVPSVDSYEAFSEQLTSYINSNSTDYLQESEKYLQSVYTSDQITKFKSIINNRL